MCYLLTFVYKTLLWNRNKQTNKPFYTTAPTAALMSYKPENQTGPSTMINGCFQLIVASHKIQHLIAAFNPFFSSFLGLVAVTAFTLRRQTENYFHFISLAHSLTVARGFFTVLAWCHGSNTNKQVRVDVTIKTERRYDCGLYTQTS